ncbi:hypothetical protein ACH5RR_038188 [Cinchona calisaya]|uniref:non-specific serine/threonine protein kinase n=1 Tax=Cinchona calisaya TaxID=153742 RepID=A0ABD2YC44_9GENT
MGNTAASVVSGLLLTMMMIMIMVPTARAQNQTQTNATTDPSEAMAVNSIFQKLRAPAPTEWNTSGELCSGQAIDDTQIQNINPGIKCDCSYNNRTLCHITRLRIYASDVRGDLPDELWNLTFLVEIDFGLNYLTGPIPSSISRLSRMQYLNLGINALSGKLPTELGMLTDLRLLGIGTNNFSGSFPDELGNLTKLEQLYFDSSGISGAIPPTFARLQSLITVWGSDTQLTGQIPDFIGSWSQLASLRFQGNSFHGTIPSSFANLTSLTDLRIGDISNGSFTLDFIRDMKSLSTLILRNNNISGSIPSNIGEYKSLKLMDLSFNNLSGRIPDALFNLSSLTYLFLGNNKFTGSLPSQKSGNLQTIDLSYNELSGGIPSWVGDQNLQLNLVANNLTLSDSSISGLPTGLNCLQQNFPCNRGSPIYYNFAIRCGGPPKTSSDLILFEADNETLGPATYYMTNTQRWAVSNVGLPLDSSSPKYTFSSTRQYTNTVNSELFQTARVSAGSLRYYGLGLENGNYTVQLQFAESEIEDTVTWKSLGRRLFNIYVQGNLELKDFDIKKTAGGRSYTAVEMEFKAHVSENYLEVHLFWAGKGTCCVPNQGAYGPFISAISATPDFKPSVNNIPPTRKDKKTGLILGIVLPIGIAIFLAVFSVSYFIQRRRRQQAFQEEEFLGIDARPYTFSYAELRAATNDFNLANRLGEGGFGPVFKGTLDDGRVVAVKQLSVASHQGKSQFVAEIATISAVQHRNLVKLYGCCIEGDKRLLVYEYLVNKSLDQALFGSNGLHLNWSTRFDICLGIARGLTYLHEESRLRIVHRDVKASNILLDSDLNPKISDFGLAKLYDDKKTHISTRVAGTIGYLAPEYAMRGHLTEKADVFGFGVVALEIVSGRPNSDASLEEDKMYLLEWAWNLHEDDHEIELVDNNLVEFDENEVKRLIGVALLCTQTSPALRPSMSRVVAMLSGDAEVTTVTSRPGYLTDWKFRDATSFMSNNDMTSTSDSRYDSTMSPATVQNFSLTNAEKPMLHDIVGDGR